MPVIHFLNVHQGDCTIIQHNSGHNTMIDVNNARILSEPARLVRQAISDSLKTNGNFGQKAYPENPLEYMEKRGIDSIFRFILTHPDMDHMDGISDLFKIHAPPNFWDTANTCDKDDNEWGESCPYRKEDWDFYKSLRGSENEPKHLVYHSGQEPCDHWKKDGLAVLSPTKELICAANECGEWNDSSYVIRYAGPHGFRAIMPGDSHDATWEHILDKHRHVKDIDLLIAPHHGRHSDADFSYLDVLKPKLTLFGNAPSEHLAYEAWSNRDLPIITNNQAGSIIVDFEDEYGAFYVTNEAFARAHTTDNTFYDERLHGWFAGTIR